MPQKRSLLYCVLLPKPTKQETASKRSSKNQNHFVRTSYSRRLFAYTPCIETYTVHTCMITTIYDTIADYGHNRVIEMMYRPQGRFACKQNVSRIRPLNAYEQATRTVSEKNNVYTLVLNPKSVFTAIQYIVSSILISGIGSIRSRSSHGQILHKDVRTPPVTATQIQSDH